MSTPLLIAGIVVLATLAATAYIAVKSDIAPIPRVLRFALELAVFALGIVILDRAVAGFHLNIAPIGRNEGAAILAAYALLTVIPAWRRMHAAGKERN
ncbi:MAG: hypothetical protein PXZ07_04340 [Candidatus Eremiobacteraeota bacterium]|nr:hypothetical protein [Candidatus Eremiobacteraeota bacterium]